MKSVNYKVARIYRNSEFGYYAVRPIYKIYEFVLKHISDEYIIKRRFRKKMGYDLDLKNPKTLNEKINWLKLYDRKDLHTTVADKFKVRSYIENTIGAEYLIPLIFQTKDPKDIKPDNLPNTSFIIKTNHDSSGGIIVKDKKSINWPQARKRFSRLLKENYFYSSREWQYKNIEPRIIVEKLLTYDDGSIPSDYKFHCFNGELAFIQVDIDRHIEHKRNLYDPNWNFIPCVWKYKNGKKEEKPESFEKMRNLAETIAKDFIYVRVDFYSVNNLIYFGELTFHSESGHGKFTPSEYDLKFGNSLNIEKK
ncbi:ATP-grasp fold amidoligase family protein [Gelidibacter mesophilus]|uniref:ATP-grasp fold amidoligase family protein n=1 Tax=Gelidibacter mesophilus TaxID=169050 RepID=UPI00042855F7|nr:ATP-grasp fold amidoligase family protein [Gelidibacter mesophilus]